MVNVYVQKYIDIFVLCVFPKIYGMVNGLQWTKFGRKW